MQRPEKISNEAKWIKDCTKIRARALEVIDGKTDLISASVALRKLAIWTHAQADSDLLIFEHLLGDLSELPIGPERKYWAPDALARDDVKIKAVVDKWHPRAVTAARKLVDRYEWSLAARAARRSAGHSD